MNNTNDLISRAAAHEMVKGLQKWCITLPGNPRITQVGYMSDAVLFGLDRLPTVDAAPVVHGRWVYEHGDPDMLPCSVCGYRVFRYNNTRYCPNCGARMDDESRVQSELL